MVIKQIQVHAGRTFNHPLEQYSNLRNGVTLVADIDEKEDPLFSAVKRLQARANGMVDDDKELMLKVIQEKEKQDKEDEARRQQWAKDHPGEQEVPF